MKSAIYRREWCGLQPWGVRDITFTLGDVIVKLRKAKRWGRKRLAKEANLHYMTITRLETGKEIKEATIRRVAAAFGLRPGALYDLVPPVADALSLERDRIWNGLEKEARRSLLEVMRTFEPAPSEGEHESNPSQPIATEEKAKGSGRGTKRA